MDYDRYRNKDEFPQILRKPKELTLKPNPTPDEARQWANRCDAANWDMQV